jgi:uncharacterized protein
MSNFGNQNNWNNGQNNGQNNQNWNNQNNWNDRFGWGNSNTAAAASPAVTSEKAKAFLSQVMRWMFGALMLTALVSWVFATVPALTEVMFVIDPATARMKLSIVGWIVMFLPIILSMVMTFAFEKLSFGVIILLFCAYAILTGMSLSVLVFAFSGALITQAFLLTAGVFGVMAVAGWVTKADLSRMGIILMIGLGVAFIAAMINMFVGNSMLSMLIDIAFVVIFTGLIAFKIQQVKRVGEQVGTSQPKFAVIEALALYVTFINLFITILRLLGRRE